MKNILIIALIGLNSLVLAQSLSIAETQECKNARLDLASFTKDLSFINENYNLVDVKEEKTAQLFEEYGGAIKLQKEFKIFKECVDNGFKPSKIGFD